MVQDFCLQNYNQSNPVLPQKGAAPVTEGSDEEDEDDIDFDDDDLEGLLHIPQKD